MQLAFLDFPQIFKIPSIPAMKVHEDEIHRNIMVSDTEEC